MKILQHALLLSSVAFLNNLLSIALVWKMVACSQSKLILGLVFCASVSLPYLIQSQLGWVKKYYRKYPCYGLFLSMCAASITLFMAGFWLPLDTPLQLYSIAIFENLLFAMNIQFLETITASLVLGKSISGHDAARISQGCAQGGLMLGAGLGSFMLGSYTLRQILLLGSLFSLFMALYLFFKRHEQLEGPSKAKAEELGVAVGLKKANSYPFFLLMLFLFGLAWQIQSFNFLFPILVQEVRQWPPFAMGIIDIVSGIGSFIGLCLPFRQTPMRTFLSILMVGFFDLSMAYVANLPVLTFLTLIVAYSFTVMRIQCQELLYRGYSNKKEAFLWSGRLAYMTVFIRGLAPLACGLALDKNICKAEQLFLLLAIVLPLGLLCLFYLTSSLFGSVVKDA